MSSIVILAGSPSRVSRTVALAKYISATLGADGHQVTLIPIRQLPSDALLAADTSNGAVAAAVDTVVSADAVIVATPIYKAAYSGLLKAFLDLLPQSALLDKTVLPIATGGTVAHVLAIDYALRPVLMSLGATTITPGRFVLDKHIDIDAGGQVTDAAARDDIARTLSSFTTALRMAAPPAFAV